MILSTPSKAEESAIGTARDPHTSVTWSKELQRIEVDGIPFLVYRERELSVLRFLEIARRWGERTYVVQGDKRWRLTDVSVAAEQQASVLAANGVAPGSPVMLLGWNSIDWVVSFWAVLRVGGFVVTGNAWWSEEEVRYAIELAEPALVITDRPDRVPEGWNVRSFSEIASGRSSSKPLPRPPLEENALALAMFTSGTTGLPKAGVFSHRAIVAGIHSQLALTNRLPQQLAPDHRAEVTLQTAPLFHIGGVQAILRAALLGGTLVLLRGRFDPEEVLTVIDRERVQRWAGAVPTMAIRVAEHPRISSYDLTSVRSVTIGSTVVPDAVLERLREVFPNAKQRVGTGWGLTEAGGQLTAASGTETLERPGTVGRALPFVELRILAANDDGVGEVLARSPMQMSGYLGDESPSMIDHEGWLHTGDLGRLDNGYLWLAGRSKDLIVRGGENVAPVRVEQVLLEHEGVADVAVVGLPDTDLGEIVAAVVVTRPTSSVSEHDLRSFAASRLSTFAVPTRWWLRTDPLPVNSVGKVAKITLRDTWLQREAERS